MKYMRNSVKAIVLRNGKILLTKNRDNSGIFYILPGGGQRPGETMLKALHREFNEEVGGKICVGDLLLVREYIGENHEFRDEDKDVHQIEYMFECVLEEEIESSTNDQNDSLAPDKMQIGVEWVDIGDLQNTRIYPKILSEIIKKEGINKDRVYLGDTN